MTSHTQQVMSASARATTMSGGNSIDLATNGGTLFDVDMFASLSEGLDSEMAIDWANQPLTALEPLDNLLLDRLSPQELSRDSPPEEDISQAELSTLHTNYFDSVYLSFPFVNRDRFAVEHSSSGSSSAASALVYAVALAGCTHSPKDANKRSLCYSLARSHAEKCERDGNLNDIKYLQALILTGRFEAMDRQFEKSWLTLGRASMVCRLLNMTQMDQSDECGAGVQENLNRHQNCKVSRLRLPATEDPVLLEERRRTFWALYILQSYMKTRTGWSCQLGDVKVRPSLLRRI
jgi:transcription factor-like protein